MQSPILSPRFSHGLMLLLSPLLAILPSPRALVLAMLKAGKRGKQGTLYPTDLRRINLVLDVTSELTGKLYEATVLNGDVESAIASLRNALNEEEHVLSFAAEYQAQAW